MSSHIELAAADGHRFTAYLAQPPAQARGAIVIAPEIFGVNQHIRAVADGYAADGYLVVAPALFDRAQRDFESGYTPHDIQAGLAIANRIAMDDVMADTRAAVAYAAGAGKVGLVGYCWGGTIAWLAAARVEGLAASIAYYGGSIPKYADEAPRCPLLCHFGELDKSPTPKQAHDAVARHGSIVAHFYEGAGHGFNCNLRDSYNAAASELARERSLAFFRAHVG